MGLPDSALSLRFDVVIDGIPLGEFTAVDGLAASYEIQTYKEGGENWFEHQLPGRLTYTNVKLTRPVDLMSGGLAAWFSSLQAAVVRQTAAITAYDANRTPVARWNLSNVIPVKYQGPSFSATGTTVATESLELAHQGFFNPGVPFGRVG
jgi:phage tail-like protein